LQRPTEQFSSVLFRNNQCDLPGEGSKFGCNLDALVCGLYERCFPHQVWMLRVEWRVNASSRFRNLRHDGAQPLPWKRIEAVGHVRDETGKVRGAAQRAVPLRNVQYPQHDSIRIA